MMGNIQGFILAQSKEIFFHLCSRIWDSILASTWILWVAKGDQLVLNRLHKWLSFFISMCILTDLPKRKTLGHYAKRRSSYFYMFLHSHTRGGSHTHGFSQGSGTPSSSCPRGPTRRGTSPTTSLIKLIFHQNFLTILHGSMIINDSVWTEP